MPRTFGTITLGETLPGVSGLVTQQTINDYADMSEDYNPLHVDPEFGRQTPYGTTIAHGPIPLDFAIQMLNRWLGVSWPRGASVRGKFIGPVRPGDRVSAGGRVVKLDPATARVTCEFTCQNQRGEKVITGELECAVDA